MTEEQKEILKQANVPMTWWEFCTIKDGVIYTPSMEVLHENNLVSEEEYQYWLSQQEQIDICHEEKPKSLEEQVQDLQKEKEQLWETVQFLLKKTGMIGDEEIETL